MSNYTFTTFFVLATFAFASGCAAGADESSAPNDPAVDIAHTESAEPAFAGAFTAEESTTRADVGATAPRPSPKSNAVEVACKETIDRGAPCE